LGAAGWVKFNSIFRDGSLLLAICLASAGGIEPMGSSEVTMKFNGQLDRYANIRAWHEHKRTNRHHQTPYQALSRAEKDWLMKLNTQLAKLEAHYCAILRDKANSLRARVLNDDDWLQDFNLSLVLAFHLREGYPEYETCDENVLTKIDFFSSMLPKQITIMVLA